ncbi:MAG: hypothetical protein KGY99_02595 [Phycisphaerae bacterium]|nr:hypothetical protein [Phycisphaerae bacterium]
MNEAAIRIKLDQLHETVKGRSADTAADSCAQDPGHYLPVAADESASVEETLDQLRMQVKYLVFDLEATRRENRYLRQMLDSRRNGGI